MGAAVVFNAAGWVDSDFCGHSRKKAESSDRRRSVLLPQPAGVDVR
jgi:hypothetical protein